MTNNATELTADEVIALLAFASRIEDAEESPIPVGVTAALVIRKAIALLTSPRAAVPVVGYLCDSPAEPDIGHWFSEEPDTIHRCRALGFVDAAPDGWVSSWIGINREAAQQTAIEHGFKSWNRPESFGVAGTLRQAEALLSELLGVEVEIDAAPAGPGADPLRRRVERLLVELHAEGRLSEGQCAKILDIPRIDWRELAEFLAPVAQAVAADGAATDYERLLAAVGTAYGYLWHINEMTEAPIPHYSPAKAAYASRRVLREFLTPEQRGIAINEVGREIGRFIDDAERAAVSPATADERPTQPAGPADQAVYDAIAQNYQSGLTATADERAAMVQWATERWDAEVKHRPLINVHRRSLDDTWRQVIRHCGGDDVSLLGPRHDALLAANPIKTTERDPSFIDNDLDFEPDAQHAVADMANIGYALMQTIERMAPGYCWNESPTEIVSDLINERDEARASQAAAPPSVHSTWRHLKTGGIYDVLMHALYEVNKEAAIVYCSRVDGQVWVRPGAEFYDGRFERIEQAAAPDEAREPHFIAKLDFGEGFVVVQECTLDDAPSIAIYESLRQGAPGESAKAEPSPTDPEIARRSVFLTFLDSAHRDHVADALVGVPADAGEAADVTYDDVVSACDAHGITLPVDAIDPAVELINHFGRRAQGAQGGKGGEA
ncbi:hypothetical protein [Burkholderia gladioli]|uniref:hypothetical protein n=1 Tax=Burkholderia gladioli TaxID=28095 RepID=UPI001FC84E6C|nr:hypothetical protein [Burkholderia gladioli]